MLKKLLLIAVLIFCLSSFANDHTAPIFNAPKNKIIVTPQNPEFTIAMASNPTTGFSWKVKSYSVKMIALVDHKFVAPRNRKLMGAPGYELWTFKVLYPTATHVRVNQVAHVVMEYARPWETVGAKIASFVIVAQCQQKRER